MQTFINLPLPIEDSVAAILSRSTPHELATDAKHLHERYMARDTQKRETFIQSPSDMLAYLSLRFPATYAQIYSALTQIQERLPQWRPKTVLDLGCGPGTGIWAAKTLWPDITTAIGIDTEKYFLSLGEEIRYGAKLSMNLTWINKNILNWIETSKTEVYDLIIVANVLNELSEIVIERLLSQLSLSSSGVILMLEPGTSVGYQIIQSVAEQLSQKEQIIAPYVNNTFRRSDDYWVHFPQRFTRPEFQRRVRQSMRESTLMASDWEETKFSYIAWGNLPVTKKFWGQCIGKPEVQKGFLMLPLLTEEGVIKAKIFKRYKQSYRFAKNLHWGEMIEQSVLIYPEKSP